MNVLVNYKIVKNKEDLSNALKILCQNKAKIYIKIIKENNEPSSKKKGWDFDDQTQHETKYDENTQNEQNSDDRDEPKKNVNKKFNMNDKYYEKNRCNICDRPYDSNFWILHKCKHNFCEDCQLILIENSENIPNHCPATGCNSEIIKNDREFIAWKINKIFFCDKCRLEKSRKQAIILHDCKHLFCTDCFKKFVNNGEIKNCPLASCMKKINKQDFNFVRGIFFKDLNKFF